MPLVQLTVSLTSLTLALTLTLTLTVSLTVAPGADIRAVADTLTLTPVEQNFSSAHQRKGALFAWSIVTTESIGVAG